MKRKPVYKPNRSRDAIIRRNSISEVSNKTCNTEVEFDIETMNKGKSKEWMNRYDNPIKMITNTDMVPLISMAGLQETLRPQNQNAIKIQ